jgi:hypothetical protein
MRKLAWIAAAVAVLVLTAILGLRLLGGQGASAQGTVNFDVDPDTTGNTASTIGNGVQNCHRCDVAPGNIGDGLADCIVDVVVTGDTLAPIGYDSSLNYDQTKVNVVQWGFATTLTAGCSPGSFVTCNVADASGFVPGQSIQFGPPSAETTTVISVPTGTSVQVLALASAHAATDPVYGAPATNDLIKTPGGTSFSQALPDTDGTWAAGVGYPTGGPGTAGDGTLVRVGLDVISSPGTVEFSFAAPPSTAYASESGSHPVTRDTGLLAINQDCPVYADPYIKSQTVLAADCSTAITTMPVNTDTDVCLHKVLYQDDITTLDVSVTADVTPPTGCTGVFKSGPSSATLPQDTDVPVDEIFTINCSNPSTHTFTFDNTIEITTSNVLEIDPANNSASTDKDIAVTAVADMGIAQVVYASDCSTAAPTALPQGTDVVVCVRKTISKSGYAGSVDVSITDNATPPGTCTAEEDPANPDSATVSGASTTVDEYWTLNCPDITATPIDFTFTNLIGVTTTHVSDDNDTNDGDTDVLSVTVTATADARIIGWVFPDDMPTVAGNQLLVVPGNAEDLATVETLDNNPANTTYTDTSIDVDVDIDVNVTSGTCTATPDPLSTSTQLDLDGTDKVLPPETWSANLTSGDSCSIDFAKAVTITTSGVGEYYDADNHLTLSADLVADSDGDTVPDNYAGIVDNCPLMNNPDQSDVDDDGIGDVCDLDNDNDGILDDGDSSGDPNDNPCTGGVTANCDDNCRLIQNPGQEDADSDLIGDVCELDVDCSGGGPNIADAVMILQYILGRANPSTACPPPGGSINAERASAYVAYDPGNPDTVGTIIDAIMVLQCILGRNNIVCPVLFD